MPTATTNFHFYTYSVQAGPANTPQSLTFSLDPFTTGDGDSNFPGAASNSVIVVPDLTFQAQIDIGMEIQTITNTVRFSGETFVGGSESLILTRDTDCEDETARLISFTSQGMQDIGPLGIASPAALAWSPDSAYLHTISGNEFGYININTGAFVPLGQILDGDGLQGSDGLVAQGDLNVVSLAFNPVDNTLHAIHRRDGSEDLLFRMDPATGARLEDAYGAGRDYRVVSALSGREDVTAIAFAPDGTLFAVVANTGTPGDADLLVTFPDPLDNVDTLLPVAVNNILTPLGTIWVDENVNSVFDPGEELYGITGLSISDSGLVRVVTSDAATPGYENNLFRLTLTTALALPLAVVDGGCDPVGLAFTENTPFLGYAPAETNVTYGSIGDLVWLDANGNGIQDANEDGIEGVTVNLLDATGEPVVDNSGNPITTQTDPDGIYSFIGLPPGNYQVQFVLPTGFAFTTQDANEEGVEDPDNSDPDPNTGVTPVFSLAAGQDITHVDAGLYEPASVGDFVWVDANGDGLQTDEAGLNGVDVELLDAGGDVVATTTTANDVNNNPGWYEFSGLAPGTYSVRFIAPAGWEFTTQDADGQGLIGTNNSDADPDTGETAQFTLSSGDAITHVDAGLYEPASVGDFVWVDANGDGLQTGETGLNGVEVELLDAGGNVVGSTTTANDANNNPGWYEFSGLAPGTYSVRFIAPAGWEFTTQDADGQGLIGTNNSDADPDTGETAQFTLSSGDAITHVDAGLYQPASVGNFVWVDANGDGLQTGETGLNGVEVELLDAGGDVVSTTTTANDANNNPGWYEFSGLAPGTYSVRFIAPQGYMFTTQDADGQGLAGTNNSDADPNTGETAQFTLSSGDAITHVDAGLYEPANIGNFVWVDLDGDGLQGQDEPGLEGVVVNLLDGDGIAVDLGDGPVTTTTDSDGAYSFTGLPPGTYIVQFVLPNGYEFTLQNADNAGLDGPLNSDADPSTGLTVSFDLASGETNDNVDAGLLLSAITDIDFCLDLQGGVLFGSFNRLADPPGNVSYYLDFADELGLPTEWSDNPVELVASNAYVTITDNEDGTETVTISNLALATGLTDGHGFVRVRVEIDNNLDGVADEEIPGEVFGWVVSSFDTDECRSYNNPFLDCSPLVAEITAVNGQELTLGTDSAEVLEQGVAYFFEITSGDFEGHRFDVVSASGATLTLAEASSLCGLNGPFNTLTGPPPSNLAGATGALYRHKTLDSLFPLEIMQDAVSPSDADQITVWNGTTFECYFLYEDGLDTRWALMSDPDLEDQGSRVIPPGHAVFVNSKSEKDIVAYGQVRANDFRRPLCEGKNVVGSGYPATQSAVERQLTVTNGFTGHPDYVMADQFWIWNGDSNTSSRTYTTYYLDNWFSPERWIRSADVFRVDVKTLPFFVRDRGAVYMLKNNNPAYLNPVPWTP